MKINSFMPWVGGKKALRDEILLRFPLEFERYVDAWSASHNENLRCQQFIDRVIDENYHDNRLGGDVAGDAIREFGYDRTNFVLANTVQIYDYDGRISDKNKTWAKNFFIPHDEYTRLFAVHDRSGLVDMVARDARRAWDALHLFDAKQCISVYEFQDIADHVLVFKPEVLRESCRTPENQLFLADYGNGLHPNAIGRGVFGAFLSDGEKARWNREDFLGVLKPEFLPEWAIAKLAEPELDLEAPHVRVFQINSERDDEHLCFEALKPEQTVDPNVYDEVYSGPAASVDMEDIFTQFNLASPPGLHGRSLSVSDVVEVGGAHFLSTRWDLRRSTLTLRWRKN